MRRLCIYCTTSLKFLHLCMHAAHPFSGKLACSLLVGSRCPCHFLFTCGYHILQSVFTSYLLVLDVGRIWRSIVHIKRWRVYICSSIQSMLWFMWLTVPSTFKPGVVNCLVGPPSTSFLHNFVASPQQVQRARGLASLATSCSIVVHPITTISLLSHHIFPADSLRLLHLTTTSLSLRSAFTMTLSRIPSKIRNMNFCPNGRLITNGASSAYASAPVSTPASAPAPASAPTSSVANSQ
jgi:hypothetical protein